ncbi:MAG: thioesterase II family protein, partial [Fimbriiglobus sp.]
PAGVEVRPVLLPGREVRLAEPLPARFDDLIDQMADALAPAADRPYAVFGVSLGAILGFEIARAVRARTGRPPAHLFAAARPAPQYGSPGPRMAGLTDAEFVAELTRRWNGIPAAVLNDPGLLEYFLPILRADVGLLEGYVYRPGPPLPCGITALGGITDDSVPRESLLPWRDLGLGDFAVRMLPGDHFFVQSARAEVLAVVRAALAGVLANRP